MKYAPGEFVNKFGMSSYRTAPAKNPARLPTPRFFLSVLAGPMLWLNRKAVRGCCDDSAWTYGSAWVANIFENLGGIINIDGLDNVADTEEPCVFICNHMSTLETFLLPGIIRPLKPVTFVVKKSLTTLPMFGPIMKSRKPVIVGRANAREDLITVLEEGTKRLRDGISIIVFPQHTRCLQFDEAQFNTIGIKLARKANAPVLPVALKTDAWGQGRKIKELGAIRPDLPARFKFGTAMRITGNGKAEHASICHFIGETLARWQAADGINN